MLTKTLPLRNRIIHIATVSKPSHFQNASIPNPKKQEISTSHLPNFQQLVIITGIKYHLQPTFEFLNPRIQIIIDP